MRALNATGDLSGLGEGDVVVEMVATADATTDCQNPGNGEHFPPGQEPAPITVRGSQTIPNGQFKNGNTPFNVVTVAPPPTIAGAPDCPGTSWTEHLLDLAFLTATITVTQANALVLTLDCTFSPATTNGRVSAVSVSCVAD